MMPFPILRMADYGRYRCRTCHQIIGQCDEKGFPTVIARKHPGPCGLVCASYQRRNKRRVAGVSHDLKTCPCTPVRCPNHAPDAGYAIVESYDRSAMGRITRYTRYKACELCDGTGYTTRGQLEELKNIA